MTDLKVGLYPESVAAVEGTVGKTIRAVRWPTENQLVWEFTDGTSLTLQFSPSEMFSAETQSEASVQFYLDPQRPTVQTGARRSNRREQPCPACQGTGWKGGATPCDVCSGLSVVPG